MVHALQQSTKLQSRNPNQRVVYADEQQAWDFQDYIYVKAHPEFFQVTCDCSKEKSNINLPTEDAKKEIDKNPQVINLILYHFCRDKFLKKLYGVN